MREYLLCLFAAAAVTYLLTPPVRALALKWGIMAPVRDRDVHATPTSHRPSAGQQAAHDERSF
jgi:UDP-GlcNAc:undecaprenyl-phosphate/decaprenyl-phosphate GlcNAc-1-phosphate transferase